MRGINRKGTTPAKPEMRDINSLFPQTKTMIISPHQKMSKRQINKKMESEYQHELYIARMKSEEPGY